MSHFTHKTRFSDSSLYDEICTLCGQTDYNGMEALDKPCPKSQHETFIEFAKIMRSEWTKENKTEDGRGLVTPWDQFLYGQPRFVFCMLAVDSDHCGVHVQNDACLEPYSCSPLDGIYEELVYGIGTSAPRGVLGSHFLTNSRADISARNIMLEALNKAFAEMAKIGRPVEKPLQWFDVRHVAELFNKPLVQETKETPTESTQNSGRANRDDEGQRERDDFWRYGAR